MRSNPEAVIDAVSDDPQDMQPGTKQPDVFFLRDGKFSVNEVIAQLFLFIHPERIKGIAFFPPPQDKREHDLPEVKIGNLFRRIDGEFLSCCCFYKRKVNRFPDFFFVFRDGDLSVF